MILNRPEGAVGGEAVRPVREEVGEVGMVKVGEGEEARQEVDERDMSEMTQRPGLRNPSGK